MQYLDGGSAPGRAIRGMVTRLGADTTGTDFAAAVRHDVILTVVNHATKGKDLPTVNSDVVHLPWQLEGPIERFEVREIVSASQGMWRLLCIGAGAV